MSGFEVDFEPIGRRTMISAGENLLEAAQSAGVELVAPCGGIGVCGRCRIRLENGEINEPTPTELEFFKQSDLAAGYRLACQVIPASNVKIDIPPESFTTTQRLQIEGQDLQIKLNPAVCPLDLIMEPPTLDDLLSDTSRVRLAAAEHGVADLVIGLPVLQSLSTRLRAWDWRIRLALRGSEVVGVLEYQQRLLGLAVDIGTTKVAAYLVDLETGETLAKKGAMNPQIGYGEDVISRIAYTNEHEDGRKLLQQKLISTVNTLVVDLCAEVKADPEQVLDAVLVGNTAMHHLFAGLPVRQLGASPYVAAVSEAMNFKARWIGLNLGADACVYLPPNIAGFVGADHVAMVLASEIWKRDETIVALDIGTNTEISMTSNGRMLSCSTASGPAFEGAHIRDGMRAAPGAIEKIEVTDGQFHIQTIGNQAPVGICGSGILDAVAVLLEEGLINKVGRMDPSHPMVEVNEKQVSFKLVDAAQTGHGRAIMVSRKDINEIQLAKGAIRTGIEIMLADIGLVDADIDEVIVAGAFGTYLDIRSAIRVGMLPDLPLQRFRQIGNAAGIGARQMLLSLEHRVIADQIATREEYVELSIHPDFTKSYMKAITFS